MYTFIPRFLAEPLPMFCGTLVVKQWFYNITDIPLCPKDDDDDEAGQRALESKTP
jgi:hypothetical protein